MSNHLPKMQIPAEVLKFIDVCYGNRPSEKLTVAAVGKGIVPVLSLPVPQAKERLRTIKVGRLAGYQISKNTGAEPRVLNNIVIDVRAVSEHYTNDDIYLFSQELFHSLIFLLEPEDICPSYFVFTGRGAQIWWSLKPLHTAVYLKQYRRVTDFLIEKVWEAIERADDINCFAVCEKASRDPAGLVWLPGSYNTRARCRTELKPCYYHRYDLRELDELVPDDFESSCSSDSCRCEAGSCCKSYGKPFLRHADDYNTPIHDMLPPEPIVDPRLDELLSEWRTRFFDDEGRPNSPHEG